MREGGGVGDGDGVGVCVTRSDQTPRSIPGGDRNTCDQTTPRVQ